MAEQHEDIITLYDENNDPADFMIVDALEYKEETYIALVEAEQADLEDCEFVILKVIENEKGEEMLSSIEDKEEFDAVLDEFRKKVEDGTADYDFDDLDYDEDDDEDIDEDDEDSDEE